MGKLEDYGRSPQSGPDGFISCGCGRHQAMAPSGVSGGVTFLEAEFLGWRLMSGWENADTGRSYPIGHPHGPYWVCPLCSGNFKNLKRVIERKGDAGGDTVTGDETALQDDFEDEDGDAES